ncbi:MAG: type I DNA topoisomerase [Candidatus Omnitrophica bacterium]|nr:type I DNA topoisomerase [Candidatus Omnitrophota bacterium]MBI3083110.1 type I DNA topoisomerase [Candidatus Omnitrophota bacterium]
MVKNLVIVESPAKAKTIHKMLGPEFQVTSSMGHLVDLPASKLGVDVEHNFTPHYIVIQKRRKIAKQLQQEARGSDTVYLAPDPDREGEAISWHLERLLRDDEAAQAKKASAKTGSHAPRTTRRRSASRSSERNGRKIYRITFHEITPQAVKMALQHPGKIDLNKVNAQQARRILDRLVGYSLSPLLWRKIGRGLSAGRVQSVALRLIVDREKEIEAFVPQEYWTIEAELRKAAGSAAFKAQLEKIGEKKAEVKTQADADRIAGELRQQPFVVAGVEEKEQKRYPKPPFTTSTLQQEAFHKLGYPSARTMRIAQQLYEGLEIGEASPVGLITYMRTDSVKIANEALAAVRGFIPKQFGKAYLPHEPRFYKARKSAQEAHEAVRPTSVMRTPEALKPFLTDEQLALYQLVWQRFVASQMADAVDRVVAVQVDAGRFHLKAIGRTTLFAGWTKVYQDVEEKARDEDAPPEGTLPPLAKGDKLVLIGVTPSQHFTKPPRRYTDASLVKALEEDGIGRPSTYAPTIQTIVSRDYVRRTGGSFVPTSLGRIVTDMLIEHFPEVMDLKFTAEMEEELDRIEEGDLEWVSVVRHFYTPFSLRVTSAQEKMREVKREVVPTNYVCERCGKPMVIKWGRFGQFLSCSDYPICKNARALPTGVACPQPGCGGELVERRARGRHFYGCSKYPTCRYTTRRLPKTEDGSDTLSEAQGESDRDATQP